jgi:hypothetical protein
MRDLLKMPSQKTRISSSGYALQASELTERFG